MLVGDCLASLTGVKDTSGIDGIRHGLQIDVAVVSIGLVGEFMGRRGTSA